MARVAPDVDDHTVVGVDQRIVGGVGEESMPPMRACPLGCRIRSGNELRRDRRGSRAEGIVTPRWTCGPSGHPVASGMEKISYAGYRFPPEIIDQAIWLYLRFTLSLRDVEDLLVERGVAVSYETVRRWVNHFGPMIAADLRKRRQKPHTTWHLDEVYLKIDGRMVYLWRCRRRRRRGPRCAGPVQAKQACRVESDAQAS